jgi:2-polyprenyl-3-methyl-5-hydroxy-6-metoxy-1,4-benzoquinol methylase
VSSDGADPTLALLAQLQTALTGGVDEALDAVLTDAFNALAAQASKRGDASSELRDRIHRLPDRVSGPLPIPTTSRLPGGSQVHRVIGKAMTRHDALVLERVAALAHETRACLLGVFDADMGPSAGRLSRIAGDLDAISEAVATIESRLSGVLGQLDSIEKRLGVLETAEKDRGFRPWFSELAFGEEFRGTRNEILTRYHEIADIVAVSGGPVLDLGCGRGELVELLMVRGVPVRGVEVDPELVEFCRSIFLDVRLADAASALAEEPDGSLGGVTLIQVVEHLTPQQLVDLIPQIARKTRPGGIVVAETVNATSPYVFTRSFYLDPTHTNPIHHAYLAFLFRQAGFRDVEVRWRSLVPDEDRLPTLDADSDSPATVLEANAVITKLNQFLFPPQDYAVVAIR